MRKEIRALRKNTQLQTKMNSDKYRAALTSIFTEDQIRALFTKKRSIRNWSDKSI